MNTKLFAIASALVATATLASAAEAGGGVRLGFGFPLGTFTATPSHGGGGGSYPAARPKRHAPIQQTARKPEKPAHVVKAQPAKAKAPNAVTEHTATTTETNETTAPLTGSSALIQQSIPAHETGSPATESPAADVKVEAKPDETAEAKTDSSATTDATGNCKKFIPAIGMTVSVGCKE